MGDRRSHRAVNAHRRRSAVSVGRGAGTAHEPDAGRPHRNLARQSAGMGTGGGRMANLVEQEQRPLSDALRRILAPGATETENGKPIAAVPICYFSPRASADGTASPAHRAAT